MKRSFPFRAHPQLLVELLTSPLARLGQTELQHDLAPAVTEEFAGKGDRRGAGAILRAQKIGNRALAVDFPQKRDIAWRDRNWRARRAFERRREAPERIAGHEAIVADHGDVAQEIIAFEMHAIRTRVAVGAANVEEVHRHIGPEQFRSLPPYFL